MRIASFLTKSLRRPVQLCAMIAGTLAALSIENWTFGDWRTLAFGPDFVPMAPSTAWCVLLLSCGLLLHGQWPSKTLSRTLAYFVAIGVTMMGLAVSIQWIGGFGLPIEGWLTTTPDRAGDFPVGRMSPLTGTVLMLAALALLLELPPLGRRWWCRQFASAFSLATLLISLVMVLSYAVGMPLLYGSHTIPMALWTAITFLPLGLGLLAAAGTETFPLSLFQVPPETALRRSRGWIVAGPVLIFLLLVVGIGTVGYRFFRHNVAVSRNSVKNELSTIADLKVRNIVDWREERLSDSKTVMLDEFLGQQVRKFLGDAVPTTVPPGLLARLCSIREHNQGLRAVLVDPQMNVRLASPADKVYFGPIAQTFAKEALRSNRIVMSDLHRSRFTGEIHFDLAIPLNDHLVSPGSGAPALGLIVIEVDPEKFLYPQIQNWPTPSPTGETLLVRREGDEVLYLNELRHRKGTALTLRLPMNHPLNGRMNEFRENSSQSASCAACHGARSVPYAAVATKSIAMPAHVAAQAICGREAVMEGFDYRNKPVLAAVRSIPGMPWFVVAKVDQDEIYAPMREQALTTGALTLGFILLAALGVGLISRRQDAKERKASDQIINSLPGVFYMFDEERLVRWNKNWETVTGYSAKEVGKMYGTDFFEGADRLHIMERMQEVFRTGESNAEAEFATKDGRRIPYYFTGLRVIFDGKPHLIGLGIDITEQKRAHAKLMETNEQLELATSQAKQMTLEAESATRAKSEFLTNMSHEIRTPMTAILGYAEILTDSLKDPDYLEAAKTIHRNGKHLLGLINDILDLSKVEAGKMQIEPIRCSPCELLADVASLMRVRADAKHLKLHIDMAGPLPETIYTDPLRLRQVLVNLVGNAIKFTDQGEVRITAQLTTQCAAVPPARAGETPAPQASVGWGERSEPHQNQAKTQCAAVPTLLRFDITDTGIGMNEEQIGKLFKAFSQVDSSSARKFGGTGLGLCISKRLTEAMGGKIEVHSTPGKGSTFSVTIDPGSLDGIPMIQNAQEALIVRPPTTNTTAATPDEIKLSGRILLAEDGPDNQRFITFVLKKAGAEVTLAENGQIAYDEAMAAVTQGTPFDVILMDMQMPVLDGYEATRQLREQGYSGPIIALTAHAMATDRQKCIDAGCDDFANKPIDRQKLLSTVAQSMDRDRTNDDPPKLITGMSNTSRVMSFR